MAFNQKRYRQQESRLELYKKGFMVNTVIGKSKYHGLRCKWCANIELCRGFKGISNEQDYCSTGYGYTNAG